MIIKHDNNKKIIHVAIEKNHGKKKYLHSLDCWTKNISCFHRCLFMNMDVHCLALVEHKYHFPLLYLLIGIMEAVSSSFKHGSYQKCKRWTSHLSLLTCSPSGLLRGEKSDHSACLDKSEYLFSLEPGNISVGFEEYIQNIIILPMQRFLQNYHGNIKWLMNAYTL